MENDWIKDRYEKLQGIFKHYCHSEFDGLPIDEHCLEFRYCSCFRAMGLSYDHEENLFYCNICGDETKDKLPEECICTSGYKGE